MRQHLFPEIPVVDPSAGSEESLKMTCFRRVNLAESEQKLLIPVAEKKKNSEMNGEQENTQIEKLKKDIEVKAFQEGFSEGEKSGLESGRKMIDPVLKDLRQALTELEKIKRELRESAEKETVNLSLAIAKKIVNQEVKVNDEIILGVVREALKKVADYETINIKMCPSDYRLVAEHEDQIYQFMDCSESVTFEEDRNISSGGCVIETNLGNIDARIENQFKVVEEAFRTEMEKAGIGG